jgi:hypothetical protein
MQEGPQASDSNDFRFLAYMMALRMGCNYMRDDEGNEYMPKVTQVLRRVVRQYRKDPAYQVMIYSYFLSSGVHLYESVLKALGIPYVCISGETDDTAQSKVLYNTGKVRVALLSSAGRAGLDLHYTSEIYLTDRHWNIEMENQLIHRGVRYNSHVGRVNPVVRVYRVHCIPPEEAKHKTKTADVYLKEFAQVKADRNQKFIDFMRRNCIENTTHQYKFKYMRGFAKKRPPKKRKHKPKAIPVPSVPSVPSIPSIPSSSPFNKKRKLR